MIKSLLTIRPTTAKRSRRR